jgi:hypothetical protein
LQFSNALKIKRCGFELQAGACRRGLKKQNHIYKWIYAQAGRGAPGVRVFCQAELKLVTFPSPWQII